MTADIAHEARNPLAVQRAHLEALQDGIYPATSENLTPILEQNLLLTRLVEDLPPWPRLTLAAKS
jgi:signal transduction histidine kinase